MKYILSFLIILFINNTYAQIDYDPNKNKSKKTVTKKVYEKKSNTNKIKTTKSNRIKKSSKIEKEINNENGNDYDKDGILDKIDKCPHQYGDLKNEGCPNINLDTDGDGVEDKLDKCPNEAGSKFNYGCPNAKNNELIKQENIGKAMPSEIIDLNQIEKKSIPGVSWKMSKYEITVGEYLAFCKKINKHYPEWLESGNPFNIYTGSNSIYKDKGISELMYDRPIMGISWNDAVAFCESVGGRLPTADEWEYAATINENKVYAGSDKIDEIAWYYENSRLIPESVGQKKPTLYGLYDMTGNVWEWTSSAIGNERLTKGGSVVNVSSNCKLSNWESRNINHRRFDLGFRVLFP